MEHNKEFDIVYFTLFPWNNEYSSVSLSFTREFSKTNRVFYINHPCSYKDFWKVRKSDLSKKRAKAYRKGKKQYEQIEEFGAKVVAVQPPLTFPINWLPKGPIYNFFYKINRKRILKTIQEVIQEHNIKNYVFFNCYDPFFFGNLPREQFDPALNIYQCIDDFAIEPYTARHALRLENETIKNADVVVATSTNLVKLKKPMNPNTFLLPNAVELSIFDEAVKSVLPRPKEIEQVSTKMVGFTGNMDNVRMDYELMKQVALHHEDKTIVFVGPVNDNRFYELGIDKLPNVIATGAKNIRELPAYLQHFDVAIIPFAINRQTESIYPLKINEYLAAGKAVVSTTFSEDIKGFGEWIYLAKDQNHFLDLIDVAINENSEDKINQRINVAKNNTWTQRVESFWQIVNDHLDGK